MTNEPLEKERACGAAASSLVSPVQVVRLHILPLDGVGETNSKVFIYVCDVDALVLAAFPRNFDNFGAVDRYEECVVSEED